MNDLDWRRQLHALATPHAPRHDLWPAIRQQLTTEAAAAPRRRRLLPWAMAASIALVSLLATGLGLRVTVPSPGATAAVAWSPRDPRLTGAAVELHAARTELAGAIAQAPHAAFLQRLMARTQAQEQQLRRLGRRAG